MVPRRRNHRRHLHVFTLGRIVLFFVLRVGMDGFYRVVRRVNRRLSRASGYVFTGTARERLIFNRRRSRFLPATFFSVRISIGTKEFLASFLRISSIDSFRLDFVVFRVFFVRSRPRSRLVSRAFPVTSIHGCLTMEEASSSSFFDRDRRKRAGGRSAAWERLMFSRRRSRFLSATF